MIRTFLICLALWCALDRPVWAENTARVDAGSSYIDQNWRGVTELRLHLSRGVPFRVFTLDDPSRLVIDFRDLDWSGVRPEDLLRPGSGISDLRFGPFRPGWSRLVADLTRPMLPDDIGMALDAGSGAAVLTLILATASPQDFAAASGVPEDALWPATPETNSTALKDGHFTVVIDPGHGGIDPGAEREGLSEKQLMLDVAFDLRAALKQAGAVNVVLTRESDVFVSLQGRVAQAHRAAGDVFLSLHADALDDGGAEGATVYTLSQEASDASSAYLAARHNRTDVIAGADLTGSDDEVARVLLDLARQETGPRSEALARVLVRHMAKVGGPMNNRPLRHAGFSVLKSADIPSVLVEVGFLSSARDLANLKDPAWRQEIVAAIADAVLQWRRQDAAHRAQIRQ